MIRKNSEVGYGSVFSRSNNELILTNQSLNLRKKNLFGKVKDVVRFPLSDVVISNNQAQVRLEKKDNVTPVLDVYFRSGPESFRFTWEDEVKEWMNAINGLLTGNADLYKKDDWMEDLGKMADTFYGAAKKVRKVFGIKSNEQVSCKCPYCDNNYTFE